MLRDGTGGGGLLGPPVTEGKAVSVAGEAALNRTGQPQANRNKHGARHGRRNKAS
jgi:hypothetical protein